MYYQWAWDKQLKETNGQAWQIENVWRNCSCAVGSLQSESWWGGVYSSVIPAIRTQLQPGVILGLK